MKRLLAVSALTAILAGCAEPLHTRAPPELSDETIAVYCQKQGHAPDSTAFRQCMSEVKGSAALRREVARLTDR